MFKCPMCQREFSSVRTLAIHHSRMESDRYESRVHSDYALAKSVYGDMTDSLIEDYVSGKISCLDLSKDNKSLIINYLSSSGKKRSASEEISSKRYRDNLSKSLTAMYGVECSNISQVPDIQKKKEETFKKKHGSYEEYLRKNRELMLEGYRVYNSDSDRKASQQDKAKETCQERFSVDNPSKSPLIALKISHSQRIRLSLLTEDERRELTEKARAGIKFESSIEKRIQAVLDVMGIDFKKHIFLERREYDLLINNTMIIEVNGDYWHANPMIYNSDDLISYPGENKFLASEIWERDSFKQSLAEQHGFEFRCIWESDIRKASDEELISLLQKVIYAE